MSKCNFEIFVVRVKNQRFGKSVNDSNKICNYVPVEIHCAVL